MYISSDNFIITLNTMDTFLIILGCILCGVAIWLLYYRALFAPALSFIGIATMGLAYKGYYPIFPIGPAMLISWALIDAGIMFVTSLQPIYIIDERRGMWQIIVGAVAGMALGLLGVNINYNINLHYTLMIVGTAVGTFLGYLYFYLTPKGKEVIENKKEFFEYFLGKGFPVALTIMQIGLILVLAINRYLLRNL